MPKQNCTSSSKRRRKNHVFLTDDQVAQFRARAANGEPVGALSQEYGVTHQTGNNLVSGRRRLGSRFRYLSEERVTELRRRSQAGEQIEGPGGLAEEFGVCARTVHSYKSGRTQRGVRG